MSASSMDQKNGRYVQGGTTDVYPDHLGWWERTVMTKQNDDILYEIPPGFSGRPDMIANDVYGSYKFGWIVLQYNTILDIPNELKSGLVITLPATNRVV